MVGAEEGEAAVAAEDVADEDRRNARSTVEVLLTTHMILNMLRLPKPSEHQSLSLSLSVCMYVCVCMLIYVLFVKG